ncbi:MAG: right-handed parallel beta-helix repeat-containing protein, partial [Planctomycetes bacterium]|nr:right-handed parallel beta-helix repeat-containing protein [Planctomycetota bacterium]
MIATRLCLAALFTICLGAHNSSWATSIVINPAVADTSEEFENAANTLKPGDELVLKGGVYSQTGRRAITCKGTAASPITIRAADGETPILTRPENPQHSYPHNNIEIVSCEYLVIRGLHFKGGDSGVRFMGGHHITFEDCEIYETGNNAMTMNSGNTDSFIIRRNHIHHTGLLDSALGTTEGEGMYVGCNNIGCVATNHLIEGNYIHHTRGTSDGGNDGIEIKVGSYGNIVRDNVIHDTTIGTRYPGIFVYGGGSGVNVVEGNVIWNSGEAIQVVSDAIVRNNIILDSDVGISASPHAQVSQMRNVTIVNNTIAGNDEGLYIRWSNASNMILANNAVYSPGGTAVNASGLSGAQVTVKANAVSGGLSGASIDGARFLDGGNAAAAFKDYQAMDLWPLAASPLLSKADPGFAPALDFNNTKRTAPFDLGAY